MVLYKDCSSPMKVKQNQLIKDSQVKLFLDMGTDRVGYNGT